MSKLRSYLKKHKTVKIVFLGGGGGRFASLMDPTLHSGGFIIQSRHDDKINLQLHVDPGIGAALKMKQLGISPELTDILIVTHSHMDHGNDAEPLGEIMNAYSYLHKAIFIGSKNTLEGENRIVRPIISDMFDEIHTPLPLSYLNFKVRGEIISMRTTPVRHGDPTGWGFFLEIGGNSIGYSSDTLYYKGLENNFTGAKIFIANISEVKDPINPHLTLGDLGNLIKIKPDIFVISHISERIVLHMLKKTKCINPSFKEERYRLEKYLTLLHDLVDSGHKEEVWREIHSLLREGYDYTSRSKILMHALNFLEGHLNSLYSGLDVKFFVAKPGLTIEI